MRMWSRLVKVNDERGYVFLSEFAAHETIDVLCPLLDSWLPDKMAVSLLIFVQQLRAESHITNPFTVAAEYSHDSPIRDSGNSGIRSKMFFDYLLDFVAYAPRFVNGGYHSTGADLKIQSSSGSS